MTPSSPEKQETPSKSLPEVRDTQAQFKSTSWSRFQAAFSADSETRLNALTDLFNTYSKPIYAYLRTKQKMTDHSARDLTQEFFLWTMESHFFQKVDRRRGTFRSLLKTALRNFATMEFRKEHRVKRGGRDPRISLDLSFDDAGSPPSPDEPPEEVLDREWRLALLKQAIARMKQKEQAQGKLRQTEVLEAHYFESLSCPQIAARLGITPFAAEKRLSSARERLTELVADLVAETVASPEDIQRELKVLFGHR